MFRRIARPEASRGIGWSRGRPSVRKICFPIWIDLSPISPQKLSPAGVYLPLFFAPPSFRGLHPTSLLNHGLMPHTKTLLGLIALSASALLVTACFSTGSSPNSSTSPAVSPQGSIQTVNPAPESSPAIPPMPEAGPGQEAPTWDGQEWAVADGREHPDDA